LLDFVLTLPSVFKMYILLGPLCTELMVKVKSSWPGHPVIATQAVLSFFKCP
jgi:hypothetical protein